jgi:choline kinase
MTTAILLAAGQGRRLSPLTDARPKCLVEVAGRPILAWQLDALAEAGVREAVVVTGFGAEAVEAALAVMAPPLPVACRHNPFFAVADNIGSCWLSRDLFHEDALLLNGDTLVDPRIVGRLLDEARAPVTVTIDRKPAYDADDMKVRLSDGLLARIGKDLAAPVDGESIGLIRFRGDGGPRFAAALERALRAPEALHRWYLSVIDGMARQGDVGVLDIAGLPWAEIDYPADLSAAAGCLAAFRWSAGARRATRRAAPS